MAKNVIIGQSGGPTAVINSSLAGVYKAACSLGADKVYGMKYGIEGLLKEELLELIDLLNGREDIDGILVQLPLPKHIDEDKVIAAIDKQKDVDGFHPLNVAALWQKQPCTLPCTPKGILKMLRAAGVEIAGKRAVVIGRSNIVGLPVSKLLLDANATVTLSLIHI